MPAHKISEYLLAADEQPPLPLTFVHAQRALLAEYHPHVGAA
jgi:hypothetical protein